jgi:hypothetical protein
VEQIVPIAALEVIELGSSSRFEARGGGRSGADVMDLEAPPSFPAVHGEDSLLERVHPEDDADVS